MRLFRLISGSDLCLKGRAGGSKERPSTRFSTILSRPFIYLSKTSSCKLSSIISRSNRNVNGWIRITDLADLAFGQFVKTQMFFSGQGMQGNTPKDLRFCRSVYRYENATRHWPRTLVKICHCNNALSHSSNKSPTCWLCWPGQKGHRPVELARIG